MLERDLQSATAAFLRFALPADACFHHSPNEGKRGYQAQRDLKSSGVMTGFPDIVILHRGKAFCIELKPAGKYPSPEQRQAHQRLRDCGIPVTVCHSVPEVELALTGFGIGLSARVAA